MHIQGNVWLYTDNTGICHLERYISWSRIYIMEYREYSGGVFFWYLAYFTWWGMICYTFFLAHNTCERLTHRFGLSGLHLPHSEIFDARSGKYLFENIKKRCFSNKEIHHDCFLFSPLSRSFHESSQGDSQKAKWTGFGICGVFSQRLLRYFPVPGADYFKRSVFGLSETSLPSGKRDHIITYLWKITIL